jgi:hypothetical protein
VAARLQHLLRNQLGQHRQQTLAAAAGRLAEMERQVHRAERCRGVVGTI